MKRPLFLFFLIILAFVLLPNTSCKKNSNSIVVEGIVNDPNSGGTVEGVKVIFSSSKITDGVYNSGFQEIARTTTDAAGHFMFELEEERTAGYRLAFSKDGYFSFSEDLSTDEISGGTPYSANFNIYPVGYIKLHVKNCLPIDSSDFISYTFSSGYLGCYECCDNSLRYGHGENVDEWLKCKTYGNQNVQIVWNVNKNNNPMQYHTEIYCKAHDTVTYEINY